MKILLTDASSLTSRQLLTILTQKHHEVHTLSSPGLSLAKLSLLSAKNHPVPAFGIAPYKWLDAALSAIHQEEQLTGEPFDVLLCSQEQVSIVSAEIAQIEATTGIGVAVPSFASLRRVMDKISASSSLAQARVPQPESMVVDFGVDGVGLDEDERWRAFLPGYLKFPIGTAGRGVRRVETMRDVVSCWAQKGGFSPPRDRFRSGLEGKLLLQKEESGSLVMVSAVFDHGILKVWHAAVRVHEGIGGGASKKVSLPLPIIEAHLVRLGRELAWHGALSLDGILCGGEEQVVYVDVNPRIVEPVNGLLAGVDLVGELLELSVRNRDKKTNGFRGRRGRENHEGRTAVQNWKHGIEGVESHQLLLALMKKAKRGRLQLLLEVFKAAMRFEMYAGSVEELTPIDGVWSFLVLCVFVALLTLGGGLVVERLSSEAVGGYALSEEGWREILRRVDMSEVKRTGVDELVGEESWECEAGEM